MTTLADSRLSKSPRPGAINSHLRGAHKPRKSAKDRKELALVISPNTGPALMDDSQAEVVAFLRDPASYLHDAEAIQVIETHISLVFLAGAYAFKLKRAVKYPYLDFSTLQLREAACRAELALNRRTAPQLYLAVREIIRSSDGQLSWSNGGYAAGEPIDFVVVMHRFDQLDLLDDLARRDELSIELLHALAAHIVQFHDKAERVLDRDGATAMAELVRTNLAILRSCRAADFAAPQLDRIECRLTAELAETEALLEDRRQAGKVRRCHGDLHLRNICLVDGKPQLFDCIEFSEAIASIDVLYDVAFLLMDLEHRGHRHSANLVLNRYLDLSNEDDGLGAVPLFIALRAMIRAHVVATAAQHGWGTGDAESGFLDARGYLGDAELILTSGSPRLISIGGLSGTGKSTVAGRLAPDLGRRPSARVLRSDVLRKVMFGTEPESRLPPDAYAPDIGERLYSSLCERAALALRAGYSAVIDAVALREDERRAFEGIAVKCRAPFTGIWLEANPECILERVSLRAGDASDASPKIVRANWHKIRVHSIGFASTRVVLPTQPSRQFTG